MAAVREQDTETISMAHNRMSTRNILARGLVLMAVLCIYGFSFIGGSALLLGASSTAAQAHGAGGGGGGGGHGGGGGFGHGGGGFGHGGGFHGGGFRGGGFGVGVGLGLYGYGYPYGYGGYYEDEGGCYIEQHRVHTRHGWRIRRVEVCE
jgi:hypothetical protein